MTATIPRPDLSKRKAVSKSALTSFDSCQQQHWFDLHYRLPLIPQERISFGSALDRAVEVVIAYLRMGQPVDFDVADLAAEEKVREDGVDVNLDEVRHATRRFVTDIAHEYDWRLARLQEHLSATDPDLGDLDGHPDIILPVDDDTVDVVDIKSSNRAKANEPTVELGFYAFLTNLAEGKRVRRVGYFTWVRTTKPYWQTLWFPVTDELIRWTVERTAAYVRAKRTDERMNGKSESPQNWSMTGGPKYGNGSCLSCQYAPMCSIAYRVEVSDDAA